mgnify:CR=1 FL=1
MKLGGLQALSILINWKQWRLLKTQQNNLNFPLIQTQYENKVSLKQKENLRGIFKAQEHNNNSHLNTPLKWGCLKFLRSAFSRWV